MTLSDFYCLFNYIFDEQKVFYQIHQNFFLELYLNFSKFRQAIGFISN